MSTIIGLVSTFRLPLQCDELVGLFRRNYDENRGEKRKLPTKFMIYAKIVGFLTDKKCLIL